MFNETFWDGAEAIIMTTTLEESQTSKLKISVNAVQNDPREEVQALVEAVGADNAVMLSTRLSNFLLWFERRVIPHLESQR